MATTHLSAFLNSFARRPSAEALADQSDAQLVERALGGRDKAAFRTIVHRHGAMVFRVCWRVLQHDQDAEDCFQATFLVLARALGGLRKRASLASWLHGVAHRVAQKARVGIAVRRRHESQARVPQPVLAPDVTWGELRVVLDAELGRLPEKWRLPLILCYLEGWTQNEAARQLGWSKNTLRNRLDEARTALGRRLTRRGIVMPAALSAVLLSDCIASASTPARLAGPMAEAASLVAAGQATTPGVIPAKVAALTEGVITAMFFEKLKLTAAVLLAMVLVTAAGVFLALRPAQAQPTQIGKASLKADPASGGAQEKKEKAPATAEELATVGGKVIYNGKPLTDGVITFHCKDDQFVGGKIKDGMFRVDRVPFGEIKVTIESKKVQVPAKFADPDTSGLSIDVKRVKLPVSFMLNGPGGGG
jgi:RNA polymerase sigma factor (sigma-70 family)